METIVIFKIFGGIKQTIAILSAMSDQHAVNVAQDFYNRNGLIGRHYCETSSGKTFSI